MAKKYIVPDLSEKIDPVSTTVSPETKVNLVNGIAPLGLNLDLGRQDLNDNFRLIQEKINEMIK